MLVEHGMMGREYDQVLSNTVAAFALGDYEWLLALEADELHDIVDLMRHLRYSGAQTPCAGGDPVLHRPPGRRGRGRRGAAVTGSLPCASASATHRSAAAPAYDAVLLAGFGGPEGPDDVMPFLRNVTRGRGIPEERLVEVSHHYQALGGVSPDQRAEPRAAGGAGARAAAPRDRRAGAVGQPQLGAVSRRRGARRPTTAASAGCSAWPRPRTRPTRRAGSTARTSGSRCTPPRSSVAVADRQGAPVLRPRRLRGAVRRRHGRRRSARRPAPACRHRRSKSCSPPTRFPRPWPTPPAPPNSATTGPGGAYVRQHLAVARAVLDGSDAAQRDATPVPPGTAGSWPTSPAPGPPTCRGWSPTSTTSSPICAAAGRRG